MFRYYSRERVNQRYDVQEDIWSVESRDILSLGCISLGGKFLFGSSGEVDIGQC